MILYYSEVDKWSNLYAYQIGLGVSYGHGFKLVKIPEIVFNYGCIVRDSVQGVISGAIYCHWHMGADYNNYIGQGVNYRQWLQIKNIQKTLQQ